MSVRSAFDDFIPDQVWSLHWLEFISKTLVTLHIPLLELLNTKIYSMRELEGMHAYMHTCMHVLNLRIEKMSIRTVPLAQPKLASKFWQVNSQCPWEWHRMVRGSNFVSKVGKGQKKCHLAPAVLGTCHHVNQNKLKDNVPCHVPWSCAMTAMSCACGHSIPCHVRVGIAGSSRHIRHIRIYWICHILAEKASDKIICDQIQAY